MTKKTKMTNKITPFAVDMSRATEEEIRWLYAKCLEVGAKQYDTEEEFVNFRTDYTYMGVDVTLDIISSHHAFIYNNNILTLDQVESHLGLTPTSEADTSSVSDSPVKWTIAMQKAGTPLEVGMIALLGYGLDQGVTGKEVKVDYIGKMYVTYTPLEDLEDESTCFPEALSPFPEEGTPEQVKQREEFEEVMRNNGIEELTTNIDEVYEELKHLFKY